MLFVPCACPPASSESKEAELDNFPNSPALFANSPLRPRPCHASRWETLRRTRSMNRDGRGGGSGRASNFAYGLIARSISRPTLRVHGSCANAEGLLTASKYLLRVRRTALDQRPHLPFTNRFPLSLSCHRCAAREHRHQRCAVGHEGPEALVGSSEELPGLQATHWRSWQVSLGDCPRLVTTARLLLTNPLLPPSPSCAGSSRSVSKGQCSLLCAADRSRRTNSLCIGLVAPDWREAIAGDLGGGGSPGRRESAPDGWAASPPGRYP